MTKQTLKAGTRIQMLRGEMEMATVARWTARNGSIKNHVSPINGGWHIVKFDNGGGLCVHESGFRVVDNRI